MLCCALGLTAIATGGAAIRPMRRLLHGPRLYGAAAILALGGAGVIQHHLAHYAARAEANGRDIMAEIRAAPICTGAPVHRERFNHS